jgi:leader peptidase (prepilin peptidase) / N-methyltransferase
VSPLLVVPVAAVGALLGPPLRARIFHHSVGGEESRWRRLCPHCGQELLAAGWAGLVGVLSPSGRCRACRRRIGPPPGLVEVVTAAVFAVLALLISPPLVLVTFCWLAAIGVALGFIDVAVHRLPDQLTAAAFFGVVVGLGLTALVEHDLLRAAWAVLNGLGMAAFYILLILIYPAGMGLGDAKLALSLGCALGWYGWMATVIGTAAGFLFAGLLSIGLLLLGRVTRKSQLPHGPFMLLGTLAALALMP